MKFFIAFSVIFGLCFLGFNNILYSQDISPLEVYNSMTLKEKVGQLLMFGFKGTEMNEELQKYIKEYKVGGIILFSSNIEEPFQVARLCTSMNAENHDGIPLLIAIDQEGGDVIRIKNTVTMFPGNMAVGATGSSSLSYYNGKIIGEELNSMGINMNLAPVLDVNVNPQNPVIGIRSYGSYAKLVARQGYWYIKGLQSENVISTAKHFPGHGDTIQDSHHFLPVVKSSLAKLDKVELAPFKEAIFAGVDSIMTAHVYYSAIDKKVLPASLSFNVITRLLRQQLNFEGIVVTDEMEMGALQENTSLAESSIRALEAGSDMVMIVWNRQNKDAVYKSLINAVKTGRISENRLKESVLRIIKLKLKRNLFFKKNINLEKMAKTLNNFFNKNIATAIFNKSITLLRNNNNLIPVAEANYKLNVLSFYKPFINYIKNLKNKNINLLEVKNIAELTKLSAFFNHEDSLNNILVVGIKNPKNLQGLSAFVNNLKIRTIICSFGSPYFIREFKKADSFVCSYSSNSEALKACIEVITGKLSPEGKLPVTIPGLASYGFSLGFQNL